MKVGDKCFIIENNTRAKEVTIKGYSSGLYTVKTADGKALRIRADRMYKTQEVAKDHVLPPPEPLRVNYYGQLQ